jgi:hypothetical protein
MSKSAQIDYKSYAEQMRAALSGSEICNEDRSLNHSYFNTKKGFYWSDKNQEQLIQGVLSHELDIPTIREQLFKNGKSEMELELRLCLLFNAKDLKGISDKDIK